MPQNGFHGLVGLATARRLARRVPSAAVESAALGVTLGAMLPDADLYPTAIAYLLGHKDLVYVLHRTATHSLAAILAVGLLGLAARRSVKLSWLCRGFALGLVTHDVLDIFFWFAPIDLLWPLPFPPLNLWAGVHIPDLVINLRDAFEFLAVALYLSALRRIAGPAQPGLKRWESACWILFAVALGGAFCLSPGKQTLLVMTPLLLAFAPYCWIQTVRLRGAIARWCLDRV